jgi:hypothetical protein
MSELSTSDGVRSERERVRDYISTTDQEDLSIADLPGEEKRTTALHLGKLFHGKASNQETEQNESTQP